MTKTLLEIVCETIGETDENIIKDSKDQISEGVYSMDFPGNKTFWYGTYENFVSHLLEELPANFQHYTNAFIASCFERLNISDDDIENLRTNDFEIELKLKKLIEAELILRSDVDGYEFYKEVLNKAIEEDGIASILGYYGGEDAKFSCEFEGTEYLVFRM